MIASGPGTVHVSTLLTLARVGKGRELLRMPFRRSVGSARMQEKDLYQFDPQVAANGSGRPAQRLECHGSVAGIE